MSASPSLAIIIRESDLEIIEPPIGRGAFGLVYRGRWNGAMDVCVKVRASALCAVVALVQRSAELLCFWLVTRAGTSSWGLFRCLI